MYTFRRLMAVHENQGQVLVGKSSPKLGAKTAKFDGTMVGPELVLKWLKLQVFLTEHGRRKALVWLVLCWEHTIISKLKTLESLLPWDLTKPLSQLARSGFVYTHPNFVESLPCDILDVFRPVLIRLRDVDCFTYV